MSSKRFSYSNTTLVKVKLDMCIGTEVFRGIQIQLLLKLNKYAIVNKRWDI